MIKPFPLYQSVLSFVWTLLLQTLFTAPGWSQLPRVATGRLIRHAEFPSAFVTARHVDVWLPEGYTPEKQYAVLYMHDGQMLFDSTTTWNQQEWGVDETLGRLLRQKKIRDCIVVGVWNGGKYRHTDYFPQKPFESLAPDVRDSLYTSLRTSGQAVFQGEEVHSDAYLKFLVTELKPFIDSAYSTKNDRKNTFVAGSSMGGLISLYAICEYPEVFGGAACLSTHWPGIFTVENNPIPAAFLQYMRNHLPHPRTHKIYFDYGDATLDALYPPLQRQADVVMREKGFRRKNWITRYFPGADHSEQAWRQRLEVPVLFLLRR
ncbi:MAG TPA: alpha/beta hydrolase-fold protein [Lacibacter sp.]|nr:alpha/beta hydrolase-fold protein [Lacibacter sp.]HMO90152.1 alpha/beta hydrolase-fold protein [Lacibacter sp.]HMP85839.1 alpha/beta hydrolase-fold protein [Lacibacter sp.]